MEEFLTSPIHYFEGFNYDRAEYLLLRNPQFVFFGYPTYLLNDEKKLDKLAQFWLDEIDNDFDIVLLLEGNDLYDSDSMRVIYSLEGINRTMG